MKCRLIQLFILLITFTIFLTSCGKDKGPIYIDSINEPDSISFKKDIQPMFDQYCILCHNENDEQLNLTKEYSYKQLKSIGYSAPYVLPCNAEESILYKTLLGYPTIMPPQGSLPEIDIQKVLQWIKEGALYN